ncbi:hypothetical protein ACTVZP_16890 [Rhodobacter sp. NSM]
MRAALSWRRACLSVDPETRTRFASGCGRPELVFDKVETCPGIGTLFERGMPPAVKNPVFAMAASSLPVVMSGARQRPACSVATQAEAERFQSFRAACSLPAFSILALTSSVSGPIAVSKTFLPARLRATQQ